MSDKKPIDLVSACRECVFFRAQEAACHRHSPSPGVGDLGGTLRVAYWPPVAPEARCGAGRKPGDGEVIACVDCVHWFQPGGVGIKPKFRQSPSPEWWEQSGYCTANAPYPTRERPRGRVVWDATHASGGCGDGEHIADRVAVEGDDEMAGIA